MPQPRPADASSFEAATNRSDVDQRADWWEYVDPFDDLQPSLITAEQITNYARVTGLLSPFDEELLKGATYEVGIGRNAYYWDEKKKKKILSVASEGKKGIVLDPNSITFVETDVEFRLPQYIAIRFNLHIKLVHRGLLLGTGPIVDPGFRGRLLIPLHNLTSTPYTISEGEKIIWVEFTKTLYGKSSADLGYRKLDPKFRVFPENKRWLEPDTYFHKANAGNPIMSSISGFVSKTRRQVKRTQRWVYGLGTIGLISLFVSVAAGLYGSWTVYNNALTVVRGDEARRSQMEARLKRLEDCLTNTSSPSNSQVTC